MLVFLVKIHQEPLVASNRWSFGTTKRWINIQICVKILDNDHFRFRLLLRFLLSF